MPKYPDTPLDPRRILGRLAEAALDDPRLADAILEDEGLDPAQVAANGRAFLDRLKSQTPAPDVVGEAFDVDAFIRQITARLAWHEGAADVRLDQPLQIPEAATLTGYYHDQPLALFAAGTGDLDALVAQAADRAYQASIPWGLAATPTGTAVFNSHWHTGTEWYRVEGDTPDGLPVTFTPEQVADRSVERDAQDARPFSGDTLVPIDRRLVEQLDGWRREALSLADGPDQMRDWDGAIQGLFAKLFIVRTVEDLGLAGDRLQSVRDALSPDEPVADALRSYFTQAREVIKSDLFDDDRYASLPPEVVRRIVRELYSPADSPIEGFRYDFSWVRSDVLGQAYEQYLARVLSPLDEATEQGELFLEGTRSRLTETSVRQDHGVYYTPDYLVRHLCRQAFLALDGDAHPLPRVADFSCGSGSFLRAAVDLLLRRLNEQDSTKNWGREIIKHRLVVGVDTDDRAVEIARLNVYQRLVHESDPLPLPRLRKSIVQGDALAPDTWDGLPQEYSVVVGNPPFLSTLRQSHSRADLRERFQAARGRFDTSSLFVELALDKLSDGGALAMVVPNRVFGNRDAAPLREVVADRAKLVAVEDFGSLPVFDRTSAYIGTVVARRTDEPDPDAPLRYVRVHALPEEAAQELLGVELDRAVGTPGDYNDGDYASAYTVPDHHRRERGTPWRFYSPLVRRARQAFEEVSDRFEEVCDVRQGIRTGANDAFVLHVVGGSLARDAVVEVENGVGDRDLVESALLRPMTYGAEIERYGRFEPVGPEVPARYILYPLDGDTPLREPILRERYSKAYTYLQRQRPVLASRRCVTAGSTDWFQIERPRSAAWLEAPKLLMRDLAPRPSFAANEEGGVYVIGGTAVVPHDDRALLSLLGFLNSALAEWWLTPLTPEFRSGYRKVEPQHLRRLWVPAFIGRPEEEQIEVRDQLSDLVADRLALGADLEPGDEAYLQAVDLERLIDALIQEQTGVDPTDG